MAFNWHKKGSIQKKEDLAYYNRHQEEIEKAFKKAYKATRFDMEPIYSRSGHAKTFIKKKQWGYGFMIISIYKKIKQARNRYIAKISDNWGYYVIIGGYDTYKDAIDAIRHYYTISYLQGCSRSSCGHILYNKELTEKIFKDVLEKLSHEKSSK